MISIQPLEEITEDVLNEFISDQVSEGIHIEYKETLPQGKDAIKDFLGDVVAFANAEGGDLIFGISEKRDNGQPTGIAGEIVGIDSNPDTEILRLESRIRDSIQPRVWTRIHHVSLKRGGFALVVRVPKSWVAPHAVAGAALHFTKRNSRGTYSMDVHQIRQDMMMRTDTLTRAEKFRSSRVSRIAEGDTPIPIAHHEEKYSAICIHAAPISAFSDSPPAIPTTLLAQKCGNLCLSQAGGGGRSSECVRLHSTR